MLWPTDLMMRSPPTLVPIPIVAELSINPDGDAGIADAGLAVCEGPRLKEHADELLSILRAVHKAHGRSARDRAYLKKIGTSPVGGGEKNRDEFAQDPAHDKAQADGERQAVDDLHPLVDVDAVRAAEGDSGTGQAGDKAVALRSGDAKTRCCGAVDDDGEQRCAEAGERHGAISVKVDDM